MNGQVCQYADDTQLLDTFYPDNIRRAKRLMEILGQL